MKMKEVDTPRRLRRGEKWTSKMTRRRRTDCTGWTDKSRDASQTKMTTSSVICSRLECCTKKLSLRQRKVASRQCQVEERQQIILQHRFASSVLCWAWFEEFEFCSWILYRNCWHQFWDDAHPAMKLFEVNYGMNLHDGQGAKPLQSRFTHGRKTWPNPSGSAPTSWPAWWPMSCTAAMLH